MMNVVKFFLGIIIVAFSVLCGRLLSKKYRQRMQFFKQFTEFNERFLSEIAYYRRPLKEFIVAYAYEGDFYELLGDFYLRLKENPYSSFVLENKEKYSFLKPEERQVVEDYFLMLGRGDTASQKAYFSSMKETLARLQNEGQNDAKRYGDLYIKVGFLCGLLLLILIV